VAETWHRRASAGKIKNVDISLMVTVGVVWLIGAVGAWACCVVLVDGTWPSPAPDAEEPERKQDENAPGLAEPRNDLFSKRQDTAALRAFNRRNLKELTHGYGRAAFDAFQAMTVRSVFGEVEYEDAGDDAQALFMAVAASVIAYERSVNPSATGPSEAIARLEWNAQDGSDPDSRVIVSAESFHRLRTAMRTGRPDARSGGRGDSPG
jgi:hypothetical protein